jgi:single-strand DNA-binding protein
MSRGFSRVVLVGNLGRDPEMRYSQNGTPITNFTIAVNRRRRNQDGSSQDETDWYRITLFRQSAEWAADWLKKGSKVLVEGQLQIRTYTGQDGVERTQVEVMADNFVNLTGRDELGTEGGGDRGGADRSDRGDRGGYRSQQAPAQAPQRSGGQRPAPTPARKDDDDDFDLDDVPF